MEAFADATADVLFEFKCQGADPEAEPVTLSYTHGLPIKLILTPYADPEYPEMFGEAIAPIMHEHQGECRKASSPNCRICGEPATKVLQTPNSYLHDESIKGQPYVFVLVTPVCDKEECDKKAREGIRSIIEDEQLELKTRKCHVCGKEEGVKKCMRCMSIAYCGKDCQKKDWKRHKKMCGKVIVASNED
jgi:hypothetical protein